MEPTRTVFIQDQHGGKHQRYIQTIEELDPDRDNTVLYPNRIRLHELKTYLKHRMNLSRYDEVIESNNEVPSHTLKNHKSVPIVTPSVPKYKLLPKRIDVNSIESPMKPIYYDSEGNSKEVRSKKHVPTNVAQISNAIPEVEDHSIEEGFDLEEKSNDSDVDLDFLHDIPPPQSDSSDETYSEEYQSDDSYVDQSDAELVENSHPERKQMAPSKGKAQKKNTIRGYYANKQWYYGDDDIFDFIVDGDGDDGDDDVIEKKRKKRKKLNEQDDKTRGTKRERDRGRSMEPKFKKVSKVEAKDELTLTRRRKKGHAKIRISSDDEDVPDDPTRDVIIKQSPTQKMKTSSKSQKSKRKHESIKQYKNGIAIIRKHKILKIRSGSERESDSEEEYDDIDNLKVFQNLNNDEVELPGPIDDPSLIYRPQSGSKQFRSSTENESIVVESQTLNVSQERPTEPRKYKIPVIPSNKRKQEPQFFLETNKKLPKMIRNTLSTSHKLREGQISPLKSRPPLVPTEKENTIKETDGDLDLLFEARKGSQSNVKLETADKADADPDSLLEDSQGLESNINVEDAEVSSLDILSPNSDHSKSLSDPIESSQSQDKAITEGKVANQSQTKLNEMLLSQSQAEAKEELLSQSESKAQTIEQPSVQSRSTSNSLLKNNSETVSFSELSSSSSLYPPVLAHTQTETKVLPEASFQTKQRDGITNPFLPKATSKVSAPVVASLSSAIPFTQKKETIAGPLKRNSESPKVTTIFLSQRHGPNLNIETPRQDQTRKQPTSSVTKPKPMLFSGSKLNFTTISNQKARPVETPKLVLSKESAKRQVRLGETWRYMFDSESPTSKAGPTGLKKPNQVPEANGNHDENVPSGSRDHTDEGHGLNNGTESSNNRERKKMKGILKPFEKPLIREEPTELPLAFRTNDTEIARPPTPPTPNRENSVSKLPAVLVPSTGTNFKGTTKLERSPSPSPSPSHSSISPVQIQLPAQTSAQGIIQAPKPSSVLNVLQSAQLVSIPTEFTLEEELLLERQSSLKNENFNEKVNVPPQVRDSKIYGSTVDTSEEERREQDTPEQENDGAFEEEEEKEEDPHMPKKSSNEKINGTFLSDSDTDGDSDVEIIDEEEFIRLIRDQK